MKHPDFISEAQFMQLKYSQYDDIPVVKDLECPNCHQSNDWEMQKREPKPVGWCDTVNGFMMIAECPFCFAKFRYHINTTGRYNQHEFYDDFALRLYLYQHKYENNEQRT